MTGAALHDSYASSTASTEDLEQPFSSAPSPSFLDAALGYYSVLERPDAEYGSIGDDYDQVDFRTAPGETSASRLERLGFPPQGLGAARRLRQQARTHYERLSTHVSRRYTRLRQPLRWTPKRVKLRDKAAFVLGVSHLTVSAYWLGVSPSTFYELYTFKAALLLTLRLVLYRRAKMHYYLLDFCYYANALMLLHVWALPELCALRRILFAFSMGPLAWSIILFRNSMIFHSLDKMTSVFLHVFPPLVAWCSRWHPPDPRHWKATAGHACPTDHASVRDLILIPWLPYALWAVAYYIKIFVVSSRRIQERGYHTLFRYMTRKPRSLFGRLARATPHWLSALLFMTWHVAFCAVTFVLSWAMWQSFWLNSAFLAAVFYTSAWNGGNYYFEVFARRYLQDLPADDAMPRRHSFGAALDEGDAAEAEGVVRSSSEGALGGARRHTVAHAEELPGVESPPEGGVRLRTGAGAEPNGREH